MASEISFKIVQEEKKKPRGRGAERWLKQAPAAKSGNLSSISGTYIVEGENRLLQSVL